MAHSTRHRLQAPPASRPGDWWRQAVEASLNGIAFADPDGRLTYVNPSWMRMLGYERADEVLGRHASEFSESVEHAADFIATIRAQGAWVGEASARGKQGETFTVEVSGSILMDAAGEAAGLMASIVDISAQKGAEAALRFSEERYRSLVESAVDPIFTCDWTGRYLYANRAAAVTLGKQPLEVIGKTVDELFPVDIATRMRAGVRRVFETGEPLVSEEGIEIQGHPKWYSNILQPIRGRDGRVEAVQGVVRDITKLKEAEEALRQSEERLRQAIRIADIGIFDHDHVTDVVYTSPRHREIRGISADEPVFGKDFISVGGEPPARWDLTHPEDRARIDASVRAAHHPEGDGRFDVEYRIVRHDGSLRWIAVRSQTLFDRHGETPRAVRTIGALRDVTEEKQAAEEREQLQAQLWQAQKMESVGQLAGGVAHDFNNMLTVINGNAELALEQLDPAEPLHAIVQEIRIAGERSANLTRQLLGFARRQARMPRVLNLDDLASESIAMLRRLIGENVELVWRPAHDRWLVRVDPTQVEQILVNLAANARDAIDDVGEIAIRTSNVVLDAAQCARHPGAVSGEHVMLEIVDNGCGMDAETQAHIFEPFYTTKPVGQGTGLGLATVYGIVRQNDGFLEVESTVGAGTTFRIFFPRFLDDAASPEIDGSAEAPLTGSETVLLVEDQSMVGRLTMRMLEKLGYTVFLADSPADAIRIAEEHGTGIQLLLTDVVMPQMNGRDLADELVSRNPHLKCLLFSGYPLGATSRHSTLADGVHFLSKPFSRQSLAAKVREVLDAQ